MHRILDNPKYVKKILQITNDPTATKENWIPCPPFLGRRPMTISKPIKPPQIPKKNTNEQREKSLRNALLFYGDEFEKAYKLAQKNIDPSLKAKFARSLDVGQTLMEWYWDQAIEKMFSRTEKKSSARTIKGQASVATK